MPNERTANALNTRDLTRRLVPRALRNALRHPQETIRGLCNEVEYRLGRCPVCRVRDDWALRCHPASVAAFLLHREDEPYKRELDTFVDHCAKNMLLLDIGAHYGLFTLATLHFGGPEAQVVAVEPSAEANRVLRINLRLAGAGDRVVVIKEAIGAQDGELEMLTTGPPGAHYMVTPDEQRPDSTRVPVFSLSSLVSRMRLVPTHIKIDVEGFEEEVFRGAHRLLKEHRPVVFLELHGRMLRKRGRMAEAVLSSLAECGYTHLECNGQPIAPGAAGKMDIARLVCLPDDYRQSYVAAGSHAERR